MDRPAPTQAEADDTATQGRPSPVTLTIVDLPLSAAGSPGRPLGLPRGPGRLSARLGLSEVSLRGACKAYDDLKMDTGAICSHDRTMVLSRANTGFVISIHEKS